VSTSTTPSPNRPDPPAIRLTKVLVWPACLIVFLVLFQGHIGDLLDRINKLHVSPRSLDVGLAPEKIATSAAAAGFAAGAQKAQEGPVTPEQASQVSTTIGRSFAPTADSSAATSNNIVPQGRILWVDEHPTNNIGLSNAFQDLGIKVIQSVSTEDALDQLKQSQFDVIITSMTRGGNSEDGLRFIAALQKLGVKTPVIIYAAHWAAQHKGQEEQFGVQGITNDPSVIYHLTIRDVRAAHQATG
jgi:CheY-like chemotaxis protein